MMSTFSVIYVVMKCGAYVTKGDEFKSCSMQLKLLFSNFLFIFEVKMIRNKLVIKLRKNKFFTKTSHVIIW